MSDISKIGITLSESSDWYLWIGQIKSYAIAKGVWDYIDPDNPIKRDIPSYPIRPRVTDINPKALTDEDLTTSERERWRDRRRDYELDLREYDRISGAISQIYLIVQSSISYSSKLIIQHLPTVYEALQTLQKRYAPTTEARKRSVIKKYHQMRRIPHSLTIDAWISQCENTYVEAVQLGIGEVQSKTRPLLDFLDGLASMSPSFAEYWHNEINRLESIGQIDSIDFFTLTKRYRDSIRLIPPKRPSNVHATFRGQADKGQGKKTKKPCPCQGGAYDGYHTFSDCPYINPSIRPEGWKPDQTVLDRFKQACTHSGFKQAYDNAIKKHQGQQGQSDTHMGMVTCLASRHTRPNVWAYDSAADTHVCNDRSQFVTFSPYEGDLLVGDTKATIKGKGLVYLRFQNTTFDLYETLYVPRFHLNILSAKRAKKGGVYHNQRLNRLETEDGTPICKTSDDTGITLILGYQNKSMYEDQTSPDSPLLPPQTAFNTTMKPIQPIQEESDPEDDIYEPMALASSYDSPILKGSDSLWHQRLGHPSLDTVKHLEASTTGVVIDHFSAEKQPCETCLISKAQRQVSRRPMHIGDQPFETLHWDLIHLGPGINNILYASHAYCPVTKYHLLVTIARKHLIQLSLQQMIDFVLTQFGIRIKRIHLDGDRNIHQDRLRTQGIEVITSPPYQPEQNPFSERSGAVIISRARAMIIQASLPEYLWPEAVQAAVYVLNQTPNKQLGWKTPYQALFDSLDPKPGYMKPKPDLSNLRVYGCKAFVRINNIPRLAKMKPRAMIGYLVGFKASNIWRIWVPKAHKVINARDCVFDEASFYQPNTAYDVIDDQSKEAIEPLSIPEFNLVITKASIDEPLDDPLTIRPLPDETDQLSDNDTDKDNNEDIDYQDQILGDLPPSPEESEGEEEVRQNQCESEDNLTLNGTENTPYSGDFRVNDPSLHPHSEVENASPPSEPSLLSRITIPAEDLTPDARVSDQSPDFMVLIDNSSYDEEMLNQYDHPKRDRSPSPDSSNKRQAFASFYNAFSAAIKDQPKKVHQDDLPPPPGIMGRNA
ncbi:uncharacterized protein N7477_008985 [Penicillium maclennaniae]|uniref:uncharacterized protein n=1 Tax=Penicillium maclennaniae TaxID=1343394 RepID=UPI002541AF54|nr:uncharacterized protein N7477_008985 [Penicillium maclennaniae]KAJ5666537.1 hypothetical protein N7477_008985 [Penicillium maclennaniae]